MANKIGMDAAVSNFGVPAGPVSVQRPDSRTLPVVLVSPHSGRDLPEGFSEIVRLSERELRRSEDCYVDGLFGGGPDAGAPMVVANFARAFLDVNREAFELDPSMFEDALPGYVNSRSPRVQAGLGTIARVVSQGKEIYARKLRLDEALQRIRDYYIPFHETVQANIAETQKAFGTCILVDCHSMPSSGLGQATEGKRLADFVLGDCYGSACAPIVTEQAETWLQQRGYRVARNMPYAGGFTTRHYGRPANAVHALQIEINRGLYMDESSLMKKPEFDKLREDMSGLVACLGGIETGALKAA